MFYPGNVIDPTRSRQLHHLRFGGDEYAVPQLLRTKQSIPRLCLTPVETAPVWMPREMIQEGAEQFAPPPMNMQAETFADSMLLHNMSRGRTPGVKAWAADGLMSIITVANNDVHGPKGVVELTALKGMTVDRPEWRELQVLFFGGMPDLTKAGGVAPANWPVTLNGARRLIEVGLKSSSSDIVQITGEQMLAACDAFYYWGLAVINKAKQLAKTPASAGYVVELPPLARLLADQLEIALEEDQTNLMANALNKFAAVTMPAPAVPVTDNTAQFMTIIQQQQEMLEKMAARLEALATPAPVAPPAPADGDAVTPAAVPARRRTGANNG